MSEDNNTPEEGFPEDAPKRGYSIDDKSGAISRTENNSTTLVARLDPEGVLTIEPASVKYRAPIVRFLNGGDWDINQTVIRGDEEIAKKEREIPKSTIPPMPKMSRMLGDKTPAVMEWYERYKPAEYRARYGIIGPGTVTRTRTVFDADGQPVTEAYQTDALLARRKTVKTDKVEAGTGSDSIYED